MLCAKKEKRTIFTFFNIFKCSCSKQKEDEIILIGNNFIKIFYLVNTCDYLLPDSDIDCLYFSEKAINLFKIIKKFPNVFIFLWLEEARYLDRYFTLIEKWFNEGINIIILSTK